MLLLLFLWFFEVYVAMPPTLIVAALMLIGFIQFAAVAVPLAPLSGIEVDFLVDHDLVFVRAGHAHNGGHIFPRAGMVVGMAMEELNASA